MTTYIHQLPNWPNFYWDYEALTVQLADIRHQQGRLLGQMESLGFPLRSEAILQTLTMDILKTSEIEGENLDKLQVRSSIARRMNLDIGGLIPADKNVQGIVDILLDATQKYNQPLTKERLTMWHTLLFPTGYCGLNQIKVGGWRDDSKGPMQVVSGPIGHEHVHYEAPAAERIEKEMVTFLDWLNKDNGIDLVLKAAIAHIWFITIHPFEDGNGRIARAIFDMLLARSEQSSQRFYSMSAQISHERNDYYDVLERTQKGSLDITKPLNWFLCCLGRAFENVESLLEDILRKAHFWDTYKTIALNDRQRMILNKLLDGFEGNLTSTKWAKLAKCSQDTASRDIADLIDKGILQKSASGGRSTNYSLIFHEN